MKRGIRLPAWLVLELEDDERGVTVTHTLRAGFAGIGRALDPILRRLVPASFRTSMDRHARLEFEKLGTLLHGHRSPVLVR
jgi:hypothetical protein